MVNILKHRRNNAADPIAITSPALAGDVGQLAIVTNFDLAPLARGLYVAMDNDAGNPEWRKISLDVDGAAGAVVIDPLANTTNAIAPAGNFLPLSVNGANYTTGEAVAIVAGAGAAQHGLTVTGGALGSTILANAGAAGTALTATGGIGAAAIAAIAGAAQSGLTVTGGAGATAASVAGAGIGDVALATSQPGGGTVGEFMMSGTSAAGMPSGTDAQRALIAAPVAGMLRHNTDIARLEYYDGAAWRSLGDTTQIRFDANDVGAGLGSASPSTAAHATDFSTAIITDPAQVVGTLVSIDADEDYYQRINDGTGFLYRYVGARPTTIGVGGLNVTTDADWIRSDSPAVTNAIIQNPLDAITNIIQPVGDFLPLSIIQAAGFVVPASQVTRGTGAVGFRVQTSGGAVSTADLVQFIGTTDGLSTMATGAVGSIMTNTHVGMITGVDVLTAGSELIIEEAIIDGGAF